MGECSECNGTKRQWVMIGETRATIDCTKCTVKLRWPLRWPQRPDLPRLVDGRWMLGDQVATVDVLAQLCLELDRRRVFAQQAQPELPLPAVPFQQTWLVGRPLPTEEQPLLPLVPVR